MSRRPDADLVRDMLQAARRAQDYCADLQYDDFTQDHKTQDAVVRNLEILGEAAKSLSGDLRTRHDGLHWASVAGMRNRLIHDYFGVNLDVVWDVVENDLPSLVEGLNQILED